MSQHEFFQIVFKIIGFIGGWILLAFIVMNLFNWVAPNVIGVQVKTTT